MTNSVKLSESLLDEDKGLVLVCEIGSNTLGLATDRIQEVLAVPEIRPVHHAPPYVRGLFNLRGKVLALIDLAVKLDLPAQTIGPESRILVMEFDAELVGLLVENLMGIFSFADNSLVSSPDHLEEAFQRAVSGFFFLDERMVGLLRLDALLDRRTDAELSGGD